MSDFPHCAVCRVRVKAGSQVIFSPDGRVHHVVCAKVVCSVCSLEVRPNTPIRRDGDALVHGNCWAQRGRQRLGVLAPSDRERTTLVRSRIAGGLLPSGEPSKVWGGTSTGALCRACGSPILAGQIEYELQFVGAVVFRLHRTCYVIWQEERGTVHREIAGGSAAACVPLRFADGIGWRPRPGRATFEDLREAAAGSKRVAAGLCVRSQGVRATTAVLRATVRAHRLLASPLG